MVDSGEDVALVNALSGAAFRAKRIPGSINLPAESENFDEQAAQKLPDREKKTVVYCSGPGCHASDKAASKLENLGYNNVVHFAGGIRAWEEAGYEF
ncbi:rhodanese-like domain-containing protein [Candidatus Micrarchaeota archaeon]|nr:rhodanese-like domain-containing protein [Candidatus Micrarchaeota archaeon]